MGSAQLSIGALIALGAFHGLNPAMGWLFAVAIGLQEHSRRAVLAALGPIAVGHFAAVGAVVALGALGVSVLGSTPVRIAAGVSLIGLGGWLLVRQRHPRWVGFRLQPRELAAWSFVMASAHGAGLMVTPLVTAASPPPASGAHAHHQAAAVVPDQGGMLALEATTVHTVATFVVMALVALVVYQKVGLRILRSAWVNLDRVWAVALVGAGVFALLS